MYKDLYFNGSETDFFAYIKVFINSSIHSSLKKKIQQYMPEIKGPPHLERINH